MTIHLSYDVALQSLYDAKALPGHGDDYIYMPERISGHWCAYWHGPKHPGGEGCGCLIGTALHILGVSRSDFLRSRLNTEPASALLNWLTEEGIIEFPTKDDMDRVHDLFTEAQEGQDDKKTWFTAIEDAKNFVEHKNYHAA